MKDSIHRQTRTELLKSLAHDIKRWFTNTYDIEVRKEPLPRLGALQLLDRKKGPCEDIADLACLALRSQGIPATNDMVVYWATSTGSHFFNSTPGDSSRYIRFDVSTGKVRFGKFDREPAKVIRSTYSRQPDCLANTETRRISLTDLCAP